MNLRLKELLEKEAKKKWNTEADAHNQWDALCQEEKDELIWAARERAVRRKALSKKTLK